MPRETCCVCVAGKWSSWCDVYCMLLEDPRLINRRYASCFWFDVEGNKAAGLVTLSTAKLSFCQRITFRGYCGLKILILYESKRPKESINTNHVMISWEVSKLSKTGHFQNGPLNSDLKISEWKWFSWYPQASSLHPSIFMMFPFWLRQRPSRFLHAVQMCYSRLV